MVRVGKVIVRYWVKVQLLTMMNRCNFLFFRATSCARVMSRKRRSPKTGGERWAGFAVDGWYDDLQHITFQGSTLASAVSIKQGLSDSESSVGIWDDRDRCYVLLITRITSMVSTLSGCRYARANVITRAKEMRQGKGGGRERERDLDP